jgi:hypothetical protein
VLNIEPFTLEDVYVDTDCGRLRWKDFPGPDGSKHETTGKRFDPFLEECGGRHPLLETVLGYFGDPKFNDAVVIQGAPGCGKSSFTLRLANVLRREGLRPLRVRLKFLDLKKSLSDALAQVVLQPEEGEDSSLAQLPACSDPFLHDTVFQERTKFGDAEICPYVLILDGWDEISVAVNEGFEIEVRRMLDSVRREFLHPRAVKVRVLLTGRPSHAVERSLFLRDDTPVLTIRGYTPDQLEAYARKVKDSIGHNTIAGAESWPVVNWDSLASVFWSYRQDKSQLDILGLPLLAHLSLRLLTQWQGGPERLLSDRTALYRHLLDVTCLRAGKASSDTDDLLGQARVKGLELRKMLQQTAVAITAYGSESIPFRELQLRLRKSRRQAMEAAESAGKEHPLTSLMISFYFKGGREHLGCEFLHKSFREYLYAEAVVEALKEHGRKQSCSLAKREPYWRDFHDSDPRRQFSRDLSQILCPRPLTPEIRLHITSLLAWDIARSSGKQRQLQIGESLDAVASESWEIIRDGLCDMWDWWGEGVHLRPQPYRDDSDNLHYHAAFVNELIDYSMPRDRGPDAPEWWPTRLVNADANVGDGLCQLTALVHSAILRLSGWNGALRDRAELEKLPKTARHPYQSRYRHSGAVFVLFRPSGSAVVYFQSYCCRINAAGNRPIGPFPGPIYLPVVDLHGVRLRGSDLRGTDLSGSNLSGIYLDGASLSGSRLRAADLRGARLTRTDLSKAHLGVADLRGAHLSGADLSESDLGGADLRGAHLGKADLCHADLSGAYISKADLSGADLRGARLDNVFGLTQEQLASAVTD